MAREKKPVHSTWQITRRLPIIFLYEIKFVKCEKFATNFLSQIQGGFDMDTKLAIMQIRIRQWASIIEDCRSSA